MLSTRHWLRQYNAKSTLTAGTQQRKPDRRRRPAPMGLEHLEDRVVPATLYWQGDNVGNPGSTNVAANWNTLQNGLGADQLPASGDTLVFDTNTTGFSRFLISSDLALNNITIQINDASAAGDF